MRPQRFERQVDDRTDMPGQYRPDQPACFVSNVVNWVARFARTCVFPVQLRRYGEHIECFADKGELDATG